MGRSTGRPARDPARASGDTPMAMSSPWVILRASSLLHATSLPPIPRTEYARGVVYATAAGVALGTLGPVSNIAYSAGMSSPTFAALRATIGAVVLAVLLAVGNADRVRLRALPTRDRVLLGLTAVAQALLSLSVFAAYSAMAVAPVVAVYFCYPLLVAGASIALGRERLTPVRALALAIAVGGLVVVVGGVLVWAGVLMIRTKPAGREACAIFEPPGVARRARTSSSGRAVLAAATSSRLTASIFWRMSLIKIFW